jgi:hypothetical protein
MPEARDNGGLHVGGDEWNHIRWMSYDELGQARGINATSAKRLALRRKWRRQADNDGTPRVAVPLREATTQPGRAAASKDVGRLVSGLEAALSTLQEQLKFEHSRAEQAVDAAQLSAERLAAAEAQVKNLESATKMAALVRQSLERALTAEEAARADAEAALADERAARANEHAEASALRETEQALRPLGRIARLRQAWRGD